MSVQAQVLQYMEQNPGLSLLTKDISSELGLPNQDSVGTILSKLTAKGDTTGVIRVGRGLYRYVGADNVRKNHPSRNLFEQIGKMKSGKLLLQGEDEQVYLASPLEEAIE